jgi:uncharacterized iron-regulated membrane protein
VELLRRLHRWAGLAVGLVLGIVAASGGLLLFEADYHRARHPRLAAAVTPQERAGRGEAVERLFAQVPPAEVRVVRFPDDGLNGFELWLADGSQALADPVTGVPLERWTWRESLPGFLFELHAHLLAGKTGHVINGVVALGGVFFVLSGAILWWPGRRSGYRLRRAVPRSATGAELLRSHAASGLLLSLPLLLFAATGAALVFSAPTARALSALFDRTPPREPDASVPPQPRPFRPWREIVAAAQAEFGEGEVVMLSPGRGADAAVRVRKRLPGEWHPNGRSWVVIDPYEARVLQAIDAREQGAGTRLAHALYPIHAARGTGSALFVPAAVGALGGAWLAAGGIAAWWLRRRACATAHAGREGGSL